MTYTLSWHATITGIPNLCNKTFLYISTIIFKYVDQTHNLFVPNVNILCQTLKQGGAVSLLSCLIKHPLKGYSLQALSSGSMWIWLCSQTLCYNPDTLIRPMEPFSQVLPYPKPAITTVQQEGVGVMHRCDIITAGFIMTCHLVCVVFYG